MRNWCGHQGYPLGVNAKNKNNEKCDEEQTRGDGARKGRRCECGEGDREGFEDGKSEDDEKTESEKLKTVKKSDGVNF